MSQTPIIRRFTSEEWWVYKDLRLRALAESPDAFGSTLAMEQDRPDEAWRNRLASGATSGWDLPLVAEVDGEPVGLAWGRIEGDNQDAANLYQMWVDPDYRRHGIGRMLLESVIDWAKTKKANFLDLGVTYRDSPAMRLYKRTGFEPLDQPKAFRPDSELLGLPMRLKLTTA